MRYDGRRVVVTGAPPGSAPRCADSSGTRRRGGRPRRAAAGGRSPLDGSSNSTSPTRPRSRVRRASVAGPVDALFNVADVSSGIAIPLSRWSRSTSWARLFTEACCRHPVPPSCACRRWPRRTTASTCRRWPACWRPTRWPRVRWCHDHPEALADGGSAVQGGHHRLHRAQRRAVGRQGIGSTAPRQASRRPRSWTSCDRPTAGDFPRHHPQTAGPGLQPG